MQRNALAYDYDLTLDQEPGDVIRNRNGVLVREHHIGNNAYIFKFTGGATMSVVFDEHQNLEIMRARVYSRDEFRAVRRAFNKLPFRNDGMGNIEFSLDYKNNITEKDALALLGSEMDHEALKALGIRVPQWMVEAAR